MIQLSNSMEKELKRILNLINTKEIKRMGKLFSTKQNNYFYDTGTGKVICIDDAIYYILRLWFNSDHLDMDEFLQNKYIKQEALKEILEVFTKETLLNAYKPDTLYSREHCETLRECISSNLEQLILELTGKCNMRCKYCVYNDEFEYARAFNSEDMSVDTAKKAIDYFFEHSRKEASVTFYGGEPLVKYDLLKWSIDYSLEKNKVYNKNLTFSLTTNLTLVTEEIAEYLASVPGLSVLCSMDGPEEIQNSYRVYQNGKGTYKEAIRGLEILSRAFNKAQKPLSINIVFTPEYSFEKLDKIEEFFNNIEFLPEKTTLEITYPIEGSVDNEEALKIIENNPKYAGMSLKDINPLWQWRVQKLKQMENIGETYKTAATSRLDQALIVIDRRYISDKPNQLYSLNGCCVPGERRLYVNTKGEFYPCEKIGNCPSIGNIENGLDEDRIKQYYVTEFIEKSITSCSNCWAIRLCSLCYANRYTEEGFQSNDQICEGSRAMAEKYLTLYHEFMESSPEKLRYLQDVVVN